MLLHDHLWLANFPVIRARLIGPFLVLKPLSSSCTSHVTRGFANGKLQEHEERIRTSCSNGSNATPLMGPPCEAQSQEGLHS